MACYFRHKDIFKKAGIEVNDDIRAKLHMLIHDIDCVKYKNCLVAGRWIKTRLAQDEADFVSKLRAQWNNQK